MYRKQDCYRFAENLGSAKIKTCQTLPRLNLPPRFHPLISYLEQQALDIAEITQAKFCREKKDSILPKYRELYFAEIMTGECCRNNKGQNLLEERELNHAEITQLRRDNKNQFC